MVVCIVSDGRAKINARTLSVLAAMGVYQDGVAKNVVAGKPVTAHIYEYTTQSEPHASLFRGAPRRTLLPASRLEGLRWVPRRGHAREQISLTRFLPQSRSTRSSSSSRQNAASCPCRVRLLFYRLERSVLSSVVLPSLEGTRSVLTL